MKARTPRGRQAVREAFRIPPFTSPSGETVRRAAGTTPDRSRVRENDRTKAEAVGRKGTLDIEATTIKTDITTRLKPTRLTDTQVKEAEHALGDVHVLLLVEAGIGLLTDGRGGKPDEGPLLWLPDSLGSSAEGVIVLPGADGRELWTGTVFPRPTGDSRRKPTGTGCIVFTTQRG